MNTEHEEFRSSVRLLAQEKVAVNSAAVDDQECFPKDSWSAMCEVGLPGLPYATEHAAMEASDVDAAAQLMAEHVNPVARNYPASVHPKLVIA